MKCLGKKIVSFLLILGVIAAGVTGCGSKENTIKIGVLKTADSFALYVAEQEELFSKYGVSVELIEFGSASNQSTAYEAGELDGMMTDMVVQTLINKNAEDNRMMVVANALGSTVLEGRFLVVSSENSNILSPKQLEGAAIGISENTMMQYLVDCYLEELGVDKAGVNYVSIPNLSLRLDSVIEGTDIQAAILPDPLAIEAVQRGCNIVVDDTQLAENYSQSVITLKQSLITAEPELAAHFLDAYNEAIGRINEDPDQYKELFYEKVAVSGELAEKYPVPTFTADSVPDEAEVERLQEWMYMKGLIEEKTEYGDLVYVR